MTITSTEARPDAARSVVLCAVKVALDPSPRQERALMSHAGAARFAYNAGLDHVKACLSQRAAEQSYGVPAELLTDVPWTKFSLINWWNGVKRELAPWWAENSKEAAASGLDALARGLKQWSSSRTGNRKGRAIGFPRFKKKARARAAYRYSTGQLEPADLTHVKLPRVGRVHTHHRLDRLDGARILGVTVSRSAGRWYASYTVEQDRALPAGPSKRQRRAGTVGVDLGITHLAVLSTGVVVPNPKPLAGQLRRLRKASRAHARTQPGSHGRRDAARRLARIHGRVANVRADGLHKLTARLAKTHAVVVVEDLNVAGMVRNRRLARSISDTGWAELRRQLAYKTTWNGSTLHVADRFYASSKTCSSCGTRKPSLPLHVRTYQCEDCGLIMDRDLNAARNLAALVAQHHVAGSGPKTLNAGGAGRKTRFGEQVAVKPAPLAAQAGKTGTAAPQGAAA